MLARNCVRGVERREVDIWRYSTAWIDSPDNHLVPFECDALHNLLILLNIQKCIDFCVLWYLWPDAESGPDDGLIALRRFLISVLPGSEQGLFALCHYLICISLFAHPLLHERQRFH